VSLCATNLLNSFHKDDENISKYFVLMLNQRILILKLSLTPLKKKLSAATEHQYPEPK
jgi:hypothetical protein